MYLALSSVHLLLPVISGLAVKTCRDAECYIFNDANFTFQEAQSSCGFLQNTTLVSEQIAKDLYSCEPNLLDGNTYWVHGKLLGCKVVSFYNGLSLTYSGRRCGERHPAICCKPTSRTMTEPAAGDSKTTESSPAICCKPTSETMAEIAADDTKTAESSVELWETFERNDSFIHIVKEGLTQKSAILGCRQWFNGSLLQMSVEDLFIDMSKITKNGFYWIDDIEDSNLTNDCLVFSRLNDTTSITAMDCDETHYSICQSVADTDRLLNNDFFEAILQELILHKNETGNDFRSKNSAWDSRVTAHIVGGSGIVFMIIFSVIIGLFDLPYLKNFIQFITNRNQNN